MTTIDITTEARKMTRIIHAGTPGIDQLFTVDGEHVGMIPAGQWFTPGTGVAYEIRIPAGREITTRQVQEILSAHQAFPGDPDGQAAFLSNL